MGTIYVYAGAVYANDSKFSISENSYFENNKAFDSGGKDTKGSSCSWWKYYFRSCQHLGGAL